MGKIINWQWIPNLFLAFLLLTSCSQSQKKGLKTSGAEKKEPTPLAVELNNKGVEILAEANPFFAGENSQAIYDSALTLFLKSIELDSTYKLPYSNIVTIYTETGQWEKALPVLRQVEELDPGFAEAFMKEGLILERLGRLKEAQVKYGEAMKAYKSRLNENPDAINVMVDIAFTHLFLTSTEKGKEEFNYLQEKYPENEDVQFFKDFFIEFDREKYVRDATE